TDLERQSWFVRASIGTLTDRPAHRDGPVHRAAAATVTPTPQALLAAACAVGDRLETLALRDGGSANWIGLTLTGETQWSLLPLGVDLYGGLPGLVLFLAYLGEVTGEA